MSSRRGYKSMDRANVGAMSATQAVHVATKLQEQVDDAYSMANRSFWYELIITAVFFVIWLLLLLKRFGVFFKSAQDLAREYAVANGLSVATADHYAAEENFAWNIGILVCTAAVILLLIATLMSYWTSSSLMYREVIYSSAL